jgi:hypothetical protein
VLSLLLSLLLPLLLPHSQVQTCRHYPRRHPVPHCE